MGRRSRKRGETTRAERDAARREPQARPAGDGRPEAPWGSFPLSELVVLLGIVVMVWGFATGREERVGAGLVIASLGGGELALREHLAGFKSHTTLLAGVAAFIAVSAVAIAFAPVKLWLVSVVGIGVFGASFYWMREVFRRLSGGRAFR